MLEIFKGHYAGSHYRHVHPKADSLSSSKCRGSSTVNQLYFNSKKKKNVGGLIGILLSLFSLKTSMNCLIPCTSMRHSKAIEGILSVGFSLCILLQKSMKPSPFEFHEIHFSLISVWALQSGSTGSKLKCLVAHCRQIESEKNTAIRKKQSINII